MGGKINFKMEQGQGVIRAGVAKLDMTIDQITENVSTFLKAVLAESKKFGSNPFKQITLSPTMGAGIKLDLSDIIANLK
jgi:ribosomal protein L1